MNNLTTTQIAQLTAIITGGGYKRAADKDAAARRFTNACAEKGIADPAAILALGFEEAKADLAAKLAPPAPAKAKAPKVDHSASNKLIADAIKADPSIIAGRGKAALRLIEKEAPAPVSTKAAKAEKVKAEKAPTKKAALIEAAQRGEMPTAPDFTPPSHKPFRKKLAAIAAMVEAGDIAGLKADPLEPKSSSRTMICRYRDLAIIALEARAAKGKAA